MSGVRGCHQDRSCLRHLNFGVIGRPSMVATLGHIGASDIAIAHWQVGI